MYICIRITNHASLIVCPPGGFSAYLFWGNEAARLQKDVETNCSRGLNKILTTTTKIEWRSTAGDFHLSTATMLASSVLDVVYPHMQTRNNAARVEYRMPLLLEPLPSTAIYLHSLSTTHHSVRVPLRQDAHLSLHIIIGRNAYCRSKL